MYVWQMELDNSPDLRVDASSRLRPGFRSGNAGLLQRQRGREVRAAASVPFP